MKFELALAPLVFIIALAVSPTGGEGWFWELANGLGFFALATLLILAYSGRRGSGNSQQHRYLGIAALIAMGIHAFWFLLADPTTLEYIKFGAPAYMTAGLLAIGLCVPLSISSLKRFRSTQYTRHRIFVQWHRWLSIAVLVVCVWHIAGSGYYLRTPTQIATLSLLSLSVLLLPSKVVGAKPMAPSNVLLGVGLAAVLGFSVLKNLIL